MDAANAWAYAPGSLGVWALVVLLALSYVSVAGGGLVWTSRAAFSPAADDETRRARYVLLALVVFALVVRLAAPGSPMDIRDRLGAAWYGPDQREATHGLGFPVWVMGLSALFGPSERVVFHAQAFVGALSLLPLVGWVRRLDLSWNTALWAAALFSVAPFHVRFSHSNCLGILEVFCGLVALMAWAERRPSATGVWVGACGLAAAMCARPESPVWLPMVLWFTGVHRLRRWPVWAFGLAAGPVLGALVLHGAAMSQATALGVHETGFGGLPVWLRISPLRHYIVLNPRWATPLWGALMIWGAARASTVPVRLRVALAALVVALPLVAMGYSPAVNGIVAARYQLRALPFAALLGAMGVAHLLTGPALRWPRLRWAALALLVLTLLMQLAPQWTETVLDQESRFVADQLQALPDECTIVSWTPRQDTALTPPLHLSHLRGAQHQWLELDEAESPDGRVTPCYVYLRMASCYAGEERGVPARPDRSGRLGLRSPCREWEDRVTLRPRATAVLQVNTSDDPLFAAGAMEVGLFDIMSVEPASTHGADAEGSERACRLMFTPAHAEAVGQLLRGASSGSCTLRSVDVQPSRIEAHFGRPSGDDAHLSIVPWACARPEQRGGRAGHFAVEADELVESCASTAASVRDGLGRDALPPPIPAGPAGPSRSAR